MIHVPFISSRVTLPATHTDGKETSITPTPDYHYQRKDEAVKGEKEKRREGKKGKDRGVDIERGKGERGVSSWFKNMNNSYHLLRAQHVSNVIIDSLIIKKN